jgi:hypothetical protein
VTGYNEKNIRLESWIKSFHSRSGNFIYLMRMLMLLHVLDHNQMCIFPYQIMASILLYHSTLPLLHEGHMSIVKRSSKIDAHQKHEPHNRKCASLLIFITLMLLMIWKHLLQLCYFEDPMANNIQVVSFHSSGNSLPFQLDRRLRVVLAALPLPQTTASLVLLGLWQAFIL